jgi:localization factor PodJL
LREAAAAGDGAALFEVARRYTDGDSVERDLAKAAEWYEHAARAGFAPAQYRLGNFYEKGHGVAVDLKKAATWYEAAARNGNALAMHNLGVLYTSGLLAGGPDLKSAVEWFTKAAEFGVKDSQVNLGILYTRGMGVTEDMVEAYKWFAVAAKAGDADAATKRDTLAKAMRPDQLAAARGKAELWKPQPVNLDANQPPTRPEWASTPGTSAALSDNELTLKVQKLLSRQGFDPGAADGLAGAKTRDAIKAFQKKKGLTADGAVTPELLRELEKGAV